MTKGAWHTTDAGTRYYYGPSYYTARDTGYKTLVKIDGKTYNFDVNGYITPGTWALRDSTSFKKEMFEFGDDGALIRQITEPGLCADTNGDVYYINESGYVPMDAGIIQLDGDYYYIVHSGKIKKNNVQTVTKEKSNGLVEPGDYHFDKDGKMVIPQEEPEIKNGIVDGYYYENNVIKGDVGMIEIDGALYFVCYSGKIKKGNIQTVTKEKANGLVEPGIYRFGEDGKMIIPEVKREIINGYYYVNNVIKGDVGMIEIDGDLYYVCYSGKIKKGNIQTVTKEKANGLVEPGIYYFGEDGKGIIPKVKREIINGYYYENNVIKGNVGMIQIDGDLYFVCYSGKIKTGNIQTVTEEKANGLVEPGIYYFGEDGKIVK